jgi:hypothetical protein
VKEKNNILLEDPCLMQAGKSEAGPPRRMESFRTNHPLLEVGCRMMGAGLNHETQLTINELTNNE